MNAFLRLLGFTVILAVCFLGSVAEPETNNLPSSGDTAWKKPQSRQSALERQKIITKLDRIRIPEVRFVKLPLEEAVHQLNEMAKQQDPEKIGINISTATNSVFSQWSDINSVSVNIPSLTDVRLADILDAIILVADKPLKYSIQDTGIVFSAKSAGPAMYSRTFKVDPWIVFSNSNLVNHALENGTNAAAREALQPVSEMARDYFSRLGIDFNSPPGKSIFYNDRLGKLFVKASLEVLDKIERAIFTLQSTLPKIHIKARFVEVPKTTNGGFDFQEIAIKGIVSLHASSWRSVGNHKDAATVAAAPPGWMGILTDASFKLAMKELEARKDVEFYAEPETSTASGWQTQMRATQIENLDPNFGRRLSISGPASLEPLSVVETGPILDVVPKVLPDGHTISLAVTPSMMEWTGTIQSTNLPPDHIQTGKNNDRPKLVPKLQVWQVVANVNLWDGQTVVVGGLPVFRMDRGGKSIDRLKYDKRELMIFITATIVDPAGNRVYSEDEMRSFEDRILPQPAQPK
jgi:type II secretory pathway component GspD/PulD (secretin)